MGTYFKVTSSFYIHMEQMGMVNSESNKLH